MGNCLKIKALRLVVSLRLQSLAALGAASEERETAEPLPGGLCAVWDVAQCTSIPALTTLFIFNPALLSAQQPQVKSDSTSILPC